LEHALRLADSRAACTAGNKSATSTPMMAITTSNSTSVNARARRADLAACADKEASGISYLKLKKIGWRVAGVRRARNVVIH
jgi:hypothetical protein